MQHKINFSKNGANLQAIPNFLEIKNILWIKQTFVPQTRVRLLYDSSALFLHFEVRDCFVRSIETQTNGKVWEDSCVEFFFAPNPDFPSRYFNLEINAGGTALMRYNLVPRTKYIEIEPEDIAQFNIKSILPKRIDAEIKTPVIWTIQCRIPFETLKKYAPIETPKEGKKWRANFYKTASNNSNPHYISWHKINAERPDFHRPEFFGEFTF